MPLVGDSRDVPGVELERALRQANLPCLLMVLHQLTGEDRWLEVPFRPQRARGIEDPDDGGLPAHIQDEVVAAAADAIRSWFGGAPPRYERPTGEHLRRMMSACVGDDVSAAYEEMVAVEMGFQVPARTVAQTSGGPTPFVVVIGAGIGGLTAAHELGKSGIPYVVVERSNDVGGVWLTNRYPGAGVDTPSFLYAWNFYPRVWSGYFAKRDEVVDYLRDMAEQHDLRRHIRFGTEVNRLAFDEATGTWTVEVSGAGGRSTLVADAVVSAVGIFGEPALPELSSMATFEGLMFHSSHWPEQLDLAGKRLAVVGTGASAMQIVPAVARQAAAVGIFQRSAQWVAPARQYFSPVPEEVGWLMRHLPWYQSWYRFRLGWLFGDKRHRALVVDPEWSGHPASINRASDRLRQVLTTYLEEQLAGRPDLIDKATPHHPPYGKRMLLDNGWYSALKRDNVELFDESVVAADRRHLVTDTGRTWEADVVVLCTGFHTQHYLKSMEVVGREGRRLADEWDGDDARAYLGMMVTGFPNLFMIYGPNTNSGGGSLFSLAANQSRWLVAALLQGWDQGGGLVEPSREAFERYNADLDAAHADMVWAHPGVNSYYRNSRGRVVVNMPWRGLEYWNLIRTPDFDDLIVSRRAAIVD